MYYITSCRVQEEVTTPSFKAGEVLLVFRAVNLGGSRQAASLFLLNDVRGLKQKWRVSARGIRLSGVSLAWFVP